MIDWDSGIKPWHLVADAGFGAAMEECGFRKVGRSMWRRDGDRVVWRVALTKGYAGTPGSFRAAYGGFVKEVDELVRLFNPKRRMECMPGTSTPWHVGGCLEDDLFNEYKKEVLAARASEQARRKGFRGWWKDQIDPVSDSRIEIWNAQIPLYENAGPGSLDWAFVIGTESDVATASGLLADAWVRLGLPWVQARIDFEQFYSWRWGRNAFNKQRSDNWAVENYAAAKIAGDQAWICDMAESVFREARAPLEAIWEHCRAKGDFEVRLVRKGEMAPERIVSAEHVGRLRRAATVIAIAEALSINLPESHVDFSASNVQITPLPF